MSKTAFKPVYDSTGQLMAAIALVVRISCPAKKCGEYNMLRCCDVRGHTGDHTFVVDHVNDYAQNNTPPGNSRRSK